MGGEKEGGMEDQCPLLVGVVQSRPHPTPSHSQTTRQVGGGWKPGREIPPGQPED